MSDLLPDWRLPEYQEVLGMLIKTEAQYRETIEDYRDEDSPSTAKRMLDSLRELHEVRDAQWTRLYALVVHDADPYRREPMHPPPAPVLRQEGSVAP